MLKRFWVVSVVAMAVALGLLISACGDNDLAEDLTPVGKLPAGETPTLRDELREGVPPATAEPAAGDAADDGDQADDAGADVDLALVSQGEEVFNASGCSGCHGAQDGVGPALTGTGERAVEHAEDAGDPSPEEYLRKAILEPNAYFAPGFENGGMPDAYDGLSEDELEALVAYLLTQ